MEFTLESTLNDILDNPKAKELLDKQFPGVSTNPMIGMVKGLSLNMLISNPLAKQYGLTKEKVEALLVELNKVI
jgi:hypothetical protein